MSQKWKFLLVYRFKWGSMFANVNTENKPVFIRMLYREKTHRRQSKIISFKYYCYYQFWITIALHNVPHPQLWLPLVTGIFPLKIVASIQMLGEKGTRGSSRWQEQIHFPALSEFLNLTLNNSDLVFDIFTITFVKDLWDLDEDIFR